MDFCVNCKWYKGYPPVKEYFCTIEPIYDPVTRKVHYKSCRMKRSGQYAEFCPDYKVKQKKTHFLKRIWNEFLYRL